jgi:hypothetical protein
VDNFIAIVVDPALDPVGYATAVAAAGGGIPGYDSIGVVDTDAVLYKTTFTGSRPATSFVIPATWDPTFVDGETLIDDAAEYQLRFALADTSLADRFFILDDTADFTTLLYYDLDGAGTFVPPVGLLPDATIAIAITTGMSQGEILAATKTAIDTMATYTTVVDGLILTATSILDGAVTDIDEGTALIGVNFTYSSELIGSEGTVLDTGITTMSEYADAWNTIKVPFEATLGNNYPYVDPRIIGVGDPAYAANEPCPSACGVHGIDPGCPVYCEDGELNCCKKCASCIGGTSSSTMRTSSFLTYNIPNYNTPGNLFDGTSRGYVEIIGEDVL